MIVIAEPYLRFASTLAPGQLESAAIRLQEIVEKEIVEYFSERDIRDISVFVRVETGSTRVWVKVSAVVGVLVTYGGVRQSVDYLIRDAGTVASIVTRDAPRALQFAPQRPESKRTNTGVPGRLRQLFDEVEHGQLKAEEAVARARHIIHEQAEPGEVRDANEVINRIDRELLQGGKDAPDHGRRLPPRPEPPLAIEPRRPRVTRERRLPSTRTRPLPIEPRRPQTKRKGVVVGRDRTTGNVMVSKY